MQERQKTIKVVHVLYSGLGGHGGVFSALTAGDTEKKVAHYALYYGVEPLNEDYEEFCNEQNIPYAYISKKPGLDMRSWANLRQKLAEWQPDVLLVHSGYLVLPMFQYTLGHSAKMILVEHTANQYKRPIEWIWSALAICLAKKVVYLTPNYQAEVRKKLWFLFQEKKKNIIPNGLNTDAFFPAETEPHVGCWIGMHARLGPPKDFHTLLKAFSLLTQKYPNEKFRLRIAGDGVYRKELEVLADELGIQQQVDFLGMLNEKEVIHFLRSLDLYVLGSYGETMSTALMQAMAVQLPIVVSDIEGTRNMIQASETGLFYTNGDADKLADQLIYLKQHKPFSKRIAENACSFANKNYSHIRMFERYYKMITQVN